MITILNHIAFIMDGNRRYAIKHGKENPFGYRSGAKSLLRVLEWCYKNNIKKVTVYAFSKDNFKRDIKEKKCLMNLFLEQLKLNNDLKKIYNVNLKGDLSLFPKDIQQEFDNVNNTIKDKKFDFNVCLGYDGRSEIVASVNKLLDNNIKITEENILKNLWITEEPDLIIRTAEKRLSGFLLYQSSYSEIIFLKNILWPEIDEFILDSCLEEYNNRKRNFGQ